MSGFRRTFSGVSNQHLFYSVDLIVYVEGGPNSYSKQEVYGGSFNEETDDIIFWRNLFEKFKSATKVKFKSVGSKTTIKEIAVDIIDGHIRSVMVAMDAEFDEVLNRRLNHPNVLYTHGYSWENDVWSDQVVREVIGELSAIVIDPMDIQRNLNDFLKKIKIAVHADCYLFDKGQSYFPRQKSRLSCVNCNPADLPHVKKEVLDQLISTKGLKRNTLYAFGKRKQIDTLKHCYGHLLADYCFQVVMHYLKNRLNLPTAPKAIVSRMGIKNYFQKCFAGTAAFNYYLTQFGIAPNAQPPIVQLQQA